MSPAPGTDTCNHRLTNRRLDRRSRRRPGDRPGARPDGQDFRHSAGPLWVGSGPPCGIVMTMRSLALIASALCLASSVGCSDREPGAGREQVVAAREDDFASSFTVFDLPAADYAALERRAIGGDGEASFRLAQFYAFTGSSSGDADQELRWLELATAQGHETAKFNFAVRLAESGRDCLRGVALMEEIRVEGSTAHAREGAQSWLQDPAFHCSSSSGTSN